MHGWYTSLNVTELISSLNTINLTLNQDTTLYFVIRLKTLTVTYEVSGNGKVEGLTSQNVLYGRDATSVNAVAGLGYEFEKWQIYNAENQQWEDDLLTSDTQRQDKNITENKVVRAVFVPATISVNVTTTYYQDYDANFVPSIGQMTTDIGYINVVGQTDKMLALTINCKTDQQVKLFAIAENGYSVANVVLTDIYNVTTVNSKDLSNILISNFVGDIQIEIIFEANQNNFEISFAQYQNGKIPSTVISAGAIVVNPENFIASQNYQSKVLASARTQKSFNVCAKVLNGYSFVKENNVVKVGVLKYGSTTLEYLNNISEISLTGIYSNQIEFIVENFIGNTKIFVFVQAVEYDVNFYLTENDVETRKLTLNSVFNEVEGSLKYPSREGLFFLGWYSQPNGQGVQYINSKGVVQANWAVEHTNLFANWEVAYVTYNITYVPDVRAIDGKLEWTTGQGVLRKAVDNLTLQFYVNNEIYFTAPEAKNNYEFAYWEYDGQKTYTKGLAIYIPQTETDYVQSVYVYYKVNISVGTNGGGSAYIDGNLSNKFLLAGESVTLSAQANTGYNFVGWSVTGDDTIISVSPTFSVGYSSSPKTYIANFEGKKIGLVVKPGQNGSVTEVFVNQKPAQAIDNVYTVKLGDYVSFNTQAELGYYLTGWTINGKNIGVFTRYNITVEDVGYNQIEFTPIFSLATITYIVQYDSVGGKVVKDGKDVASGASLTTTYYQSNSFTVGANIRYDVDKLFINGNDYTQEYLKITENNASFEIPSSLYSITQRNVIQITFKKVYWLDYKVMFDGLGTQSHPYTIMSAEHFAMMCYLINNNIPTDSENKINYASAYYVLTTPVDFERAFWVPIGTEENPFDGTMKFEYGRTNIVLDKYYQVTHYEGLFGYITEYAKFIDATKNYQTAVIVIVSFIGLIIIIVVVYLITRHLRKKKIDKQRNTIVLTKQIKKNKKQ